MNRFLLAALLAFAVCWASAGRANAGANALSGIVVTVIPERRQLVLRSEPWPGSPSVTRLYAVAAGVDLAGIRANDRIEAQEVEREGNGEIESLHVVRGDAAASDSIIRNVRPMKVGDTVPDTTFIDQRGRPFKLSDFAGDQVVLAFIYTRCRDERECPLISSNFHSLQQRMGNGRYHLVEITLDPAYDRPAVLARYAKGFDADPARWSFGTGDPSQVLAFDARFGIDPFADQHGGLIHTERTVLIDAHGKVIDFVDETGWNADGVMSRLHSGSALPSNALARLDYELSKAAIAVCGNGVAGFSGLADLAVVLAIFAGAAWLLFRFARSIFRELI